ncbi:MAG TPA: AAC(3) family N-acetyltransferase [Paenibacillus sp.]|jgi:aminoglycoside 3-N-acetyltransferase
MEEIKGSLITVETLKSDFIRLGVRPGMTVIMHSSYKAIGQFVVGGPPAVILALEAVVGPEGNVVMPTHSGDLSDPAGWENPPVPKEWWETIREQMPAYDPDLAPLWGMGIIPDMFRKQDSVIRSSHPQLSFGAWGPKAEFIAGNHALEYSLGEQSPLGRIYELEGYVLLLGVGNGSNTSLHLSEIRAEYETKREIMNQAPIKIDGIRHWAQFKDIEYDSSDFAAIGDDFERETGLVQRGKIGGAEAMLIPQKELVDYGTSWLPAHRKKS